MDYATLDNRVVLVWTTLLYIGAEEYGNGIIINHESKNVQILTCGHNVNWVLEMLPDSVLITLKLGDSEMEVLVDEVISTKVDCECEMGILHCIEMGILIKEELFCLPPTGQKLFLSYYGYSDRCKLYSERKLCSYKLPGTSYDIPI